MEIIFGLVLWAAILYGVYRGAKAVKRLGAKRIWLYMTEQDEAGARRKAKRNGFQAQSYDRQADKQEKRAHKMSKKIGRGGRRSAKAAQTAGALRSSADRRRNG